MAGIGFELKKLFRRKGVFASLHAFGYATIITTGPMLLGILLNLGLMALCAVAGTAQSERELLIGMITYALLASVTISSVFSMVVTRFTADMLFEERREEILPSFWGVAILMMPIGGILWGVFLLFSGATLLQGILLFTFFEELLLAWHAMSYLTAIKDYRGIFFSFLTAIATAIGVGGLLIWLRLPTLESLLFAVTVGYGIMIVWDVILLHRYFPYSDRPAFSFLHWFDQYARLAWVGLFNNVGLFSHLIIFWFSDIGVPVKGLFYGAPYHDVAALIAFLTMLVTTVNFVVSVEVHFYPKYRYYNSLYSDRGTARDISQAQVEMIRVLRTEIFYTALKQLLTTALAVAVGSYILDLLPLGFNELMKGYFRTLCVAYGLYAIGNMLMLIQLYFVDYAGAFWSTAIFAVSTIVLTVISSLFPRVYYGFGFLLASLLFLLIAIVRLDYYTKRLPYYILCIQPLVAESKTGPFARLACKLDNCFAKEEHPES